MRVGRFTIVTAAMLVLIPAAGFGGAVAYFCPMQGNVSTSCCCVDASAEKCGTMAQGMTLDNPCCCTVTFQPMRTATAKSPAVLLSLLIPALAPAEPPPGLQQGPGHQRELTVTLATPQSERHPIPILICSLLI
jgi:hypothetical protein